jgi:hypothetical protein
MIGRFDSCDALLDERAKFACDLRALLAFGTEVEVAAEVLLFLFAELPIQEKVNDALHIVTKHQAISAFELAILFVDSELETHYAEFLPAATGRCVGWPSLGAASSEKKRPRRLPGAAARFVMM